MTDTPTVTDILDELARYYTRELRLPGDVDASQIAERLNCTVRYARDVMDKWAKQGKAELVEVYDENKSRNIKVLRNKE